MVNQDPSIKTKFEIWDLNHRNKILTLGMPSRFSAAWFALDPNGKQLLMENSTHSIDAYDLQTGKKRELYAPARQTEKDSADYDSLTYSRDGRQVARTDGRGNILIIDSISGQVSQSLAQAEPDEERVQSHVSWFSPDGRYLATQGADLRIRDLTTGRLALKSAAIGAAFAPNGFMVLAFHNQESPMLHDLGSGNEEPFDAIGSIPSSIRVEGCLTWNDWTDVRSR
jgi:WD40 repeat protein